MNFSTVAVPLVYFFSLANQWKFIRSDLKMNIYIPIYVSLKINQQFKLSVCSLFLEFHICLCGAHFFRLCIHMTSSLPFGYTQCPLTQQVIIVGVKELAAVVGERSVEMILSVDVNDIDAVRSAIKHSYTALMRSDSKVILEQVTALVSRLNSDADAGGKCIISQHCNFDLSHTCQVGEL